MSTASKPINPRHLGWPALQTELRSVESLIPYVRNPRKHSPEQVAQIAASMREWGWVMPILVDEQSTILAGHGRLLAARQLNWDEVPVMVARGWSEAKKRAYVIADNKLALNASWDVLLLDTEIKALAADDFNVELIGFSDDELKRLDDDVMQEQFRGRAEGATGASQENGSDQSGQSPRDEVSLTVPMSVAQRGLMFDAINAAKAKYQISLTGDALCKIAQTFLEQQ